MFSTSQRFCNHFFIVSNKNLSYLFYLIKLFFILEFIFKSDIHHNTRWIQNDLTVAGGNGNGSKLDQLNCPYGLCIDDNQIIYIADLENHRIVERKCGVTDDQVMDGENEERNEMNQLNRPTDVIVDKDKDNFIIYEEDNTQGVRSSHRNGTNEQITISNIDCGGDNNEYLYVCDEGNDEVSRWKMTDTRGTLVVGGNGQGNETNQLNRPLGLIVDKEANSLIICDRDNRRVVRWPRRNGTSGQTIISNIACRGLAMDNSGYLYVCDGDKDEIRRWKIGDANGTLVAGGNGKGNSLNQFNYPTSIFVDEDCSIYVTDCLNHRVVKWMEGAKDGMVVAGDQCQGDGLTQLDYPEGVIVDHLGTVYVADRNNNRVMRWYQGATQGNIVVGGNGKGEQSNQFNFPYALSFDRDGNLYVVDCCNDRVQRFNIDRS